MGQAICEIIENISRNGCSRKSVDIVYVSDDDINSCRRKTLSILLKFGMMRKPVAITQEFDLAPQIAPIVANNPDMVAVAELPENASKTIRELKRQGYKGRMIGSQILRPKYTGAIWRFN